MLPSRVLERVAVGGAGRGGFAIRLVGVLGIKHGTRAVRERERGAQGVGDKIPARGAFAAAEGFVDAHAGKQVGGDAVGAVAFLHQVVAVVDVLACGAAEHSFTAPVQGVIGVGASAQAGFVQPVAGVPGVGVGAFFGHVAVVVVREGGAAPGGQLIGGVVGRAGHRSGQGDFG